MMWNMTAGIMYWLPMQGGMAVHPMIPVTFSCSSMMWVIESLISPSNDCGLSKNENIHVRIRNFGTDSIPAGMKVGLGYIMNNGVPVRDTLVLSETLYSNKMLDYIITEGSVDLSAKGIYHFKIFASFTGDTIYHNDTLNKNIEIFGLPVVDIGPDTTVKALVLRAGCRPRLCKV